MANAASVAWRIRTGGNNANGGAYDSGVTSPGTDYSQQDAPQVTFNGTTLTATTTAASATIVITGYAAAATDNGNLVQITGGTNFTVGTYTIISVTPGVSGVGSWTLDRNCTTAAGAAMVGRMGGAHADPFVNYTSTGPVVPGNYVYVRGAGTDNPGSADYTKSGGGSVTPVSGNTTAGYIRWIGENGRPRLTSDGLMYFNMSGVIFENFYFSTSGTTFATFGIINYASAGSSFGGLINCVFDQNGKDMVCTVAPGFVLGCEFFSSSANAGAAGSNAAILFASFAGRVDGCNIHETWGDGVSMVSGNMETLTNSIVAKCSGNGITLTGSSSSHYGHIANNTIDGNKGHGISATTTATLAQYNVYSNLITNHSQAGKFGINVTAGTTAVNDRVKAFWDFNWLYNNTANYNNISGGPHDTTGTDPLYTNQSTQDYTLQSSSPAIAKGFPTVANPTLPIGATPGTGTTIQPNFLRRSTTPVVESYNDEGAVQRIMATGGGGIPYVIGG